MNASKFLALSASILIAIDANSAEPPSAQAQVEKGKGGKSLPYGVDDVVKLTRARMSEEVIVKYVQNSGIIYNLAPETLVQLRDEGVSDNVLNTMIEQGKRVQATSYWTSQTQTNQQPALQTQPQVAPAYIQPPQPEIPQTQSSPSTVYVIPYHRATYATPYWDGYYGPYSGWYGPSISLGLGFGFGHGHAHFGHGHFRCR